MPVLKKISVRDFRNISLAELEFSPRLNCILGNNGQGKTNLLDSIFYLSTARSSFSVPDSMCIKHGAPSFCLSAQYAMSDGTTSRFVVCCDSKQKQFRKNDKAYRHLSEHIGQLPVVMVSPSDNALVSESGEERRRFVNMVLSQVDPLYLTALQRYDKLLQQRNRVLKEENPDEELLDVLDAQMALEASAICSKRFQFAAELSDRASEYYSKLSPGKEKISIEYAPDIQDADVSFIRDRLRSRRDRDKYLKYTSCGPQRDDFVFRMDEWPIRKSGSQGQQKSFLVALKLSQYDIMKDRCGFPPILLLDDLFDKLDFDRTRLLLQLVSAPGFGQIFISDTSLERIDRVMSGISQDARYFHADDGEISAFLPSFSFQKTEKDI